MDMLELWELDALEILRNEVLTPGTWVPESGGIGIKDYDPETFPPQTNPEELVAEHMYKKDAIYVSELHNSLPRLLAMARELLNAKRLLVEVNIFDAFTYANGYTHTGEQALHTAMTNFQGAGLKEEHWIEHVYNVLNDTCHDMFEEAEDETDPEQRYQAVDNAWGAGCPFPKTFAEVESIQPKK